MTRAAIAYFANELKDHARMLADFAVCLAPRRAAILAAWPEDNAGLQLAPGWRERAFAAMVEGLETLQNPGALPAYLDGIMSWGEQAANEGVNHLAAASAFSQLRRASLPILLEEYAAGPELELLWQALDDADRAIRTLVGEAYVAVIQARLAAASRQAGDAAEEGATGKAVAARTFTILIVDDDPGIRETVGNAFALRGFHTLTAESGADALALFREQGPFHIVLCDLGMPAMNGVQVAAAVKALAPQTVFILMTGWASELDAGKLRQAGVDHTVKKPFEVEHLLNLIRQSLRKQPSD